MSGGLALALLALLTGCMRPVAQARLDPLAAATPAEEAALARARGSDCGLVNALWPGGYQLCSGREAEGLALAGAGVVEGGATAALWVAYGPPSSGEDAGGLDGRFVPFVAWQNAYIYSAARYSIDLQLARRMPYTPRDELLDLMAAPFNPRVLARPAVWGSTLALVGGAWVLTTAVEGAELSLGGDANLFGATLPAGAGLPLFVAGDMALMAHVAIGEEAIFRGMLQSGAVRWSGSEAGGWAIGSLIFGSIHATNALFLPQEERASYLLYSVPYITLTGSLLGAAYHWEGYSLTHPVAMHFWYNVGVSVIDYLAHPDANLLSIQISAPL